MKMSRRKRSAFTLIELVVVLMVLAIVSSLVVALAGWVRRSANYGAASHNQSAIAENLEIYRTTFGNNNYPDRFDSLLDATETPVTVLNSELLGMIDPQAPAADEFASINNSGRGLKTIMHHTTDLTTVVEGNPGNTGTISHVLTTTSKLAFLKTTGATGNSLTNVTQLVASVYPDGLPSDVRLVLLGVGPSVSTIGRTMQIAPFYTNVDPSKEYNRFIAVMAVYNPREGRRAQLKAVISSRGRTQNRNLSEFWQAATPD